MNGWVDGEANGGVGELKQQEFVLPYLKGISNGI